MIINFHRTFSKQFKQLSSKQKEQVKTALFVFRQKPLHPSLRNHSLKGDWKQYCSISAGGDLRLHYRTIGKDEVLFVAVGSHSQLYH